MEEKGQTGEITQNQKRQYKKNCRRRDMNEKDVKELLYQQLQLLAEKSEKYQNDLENLLKLSAEMDRIANTLLRC